MNTKKNTIRSTAAWLGGLFTLTALMVVLTQPAWTSEQNRPQAVTVSNRGPNPLVQFGQYPPNFELPILTFSADSQGNPIGRINPKNTIRLSSYRGKKPVCLIMSSYT